MSYITPSLTATDVANVVMRQFGDESGVQITLADIYRWINMAQRDLLNSSLTIKATGVTDLIKDQEEYSVESLKILRIQSIHILGQKIEYRSFQEAEEYIQKGDPNRVNRGIPTVWYEWAGKIKFYPLPDNNYVGAVKIYYAKDFTPVASGTDLLSVPDSYFNRIVEFVLAQAYELDEDPSQAQMKLGQFKQGLNETAEDENTPQQDFYPTITILDDDAW